MTTGPVNAAVVPMRAANPNKGFFWLDNELVDLFQPLIGADASAVYNALVREYHAGATLKVTTRALAKAAKCCAATVSRSIEILSYIGMIRVRHGGGNQPNAYDLFDLKALARHLGATSNRRGTAFTFPAHVRAQLRREIAALKAKQSGKHPASSKESSTLPAIAVMVSDGLLPCVSHGNTDASGEKHQRVTRETQNGPHLLLQNTRLKDSLYPTLTHEPEAEEPKAMPGEGAVVDDLTWARLKFDGVMKEMKSYLFAHRPPLPHLTNGTADWNAFSFENLTVVRVSPPDVPLLLTLSASDPAAARRGLEKYQRTWNRYLEKWFESQVDVDFAPTQPRGEGV